MNYKKNDLLYKVIFTGGSHNRGSRNRRARYDPDYDNYDSDGSSGWGSPISGSNYSGWGSPGLGSPSFDYDQYNEMTFEYEVENAVGHNYKIDEDIESSLDQIDCDSKLRISLKNNLKKKIFRGERTSILYNVKDLKLTSYNDIKKIKSDITCITSDSYLIQILNKLNNNEIYDTDIKTRQFNVKFVDQSGIDYGGLTRQLFNQLSNEISLLFVKIDENTIDIDSRFTNIVEYRINYFTTILRALSTYNVDLITPINIGHIIKYYLIYDINDNNHNWYRNLIEKLNNYTIGNVSIFIYLKIFLRVIYNKTNIEINEFFEDKNTKNILIVLYLFTSYLTEYNFSKPDNLLMQETIFSYLNEYTVSELCDNFNKYNLGDNIKLVLSTLENGFIYYNISKILNHFSYNFIIRPESLISKITFTNCSESYKTKLVNILTDFKSILHRELYSDNENIIFSITKYNILYETHEDFLKALLIYWTGSPHIVDTKYEIHKNTNLTGYLYAHTCFFTLDIKMDDDESEIQILIKILDTVSQDGSIFTAAG
jgi:hypothetical protein